jgi:hypothetical protein
LGRDALALGAAEAEEFVGGLSGVFCPQPVNEAATQITRQIGTFRDIAVTVSVSVADFAPNRSGSYGR